MSKYASPSTFIYFKKGSFKKRFYTVNDAKNTAIYAKYKELTDAQSKVIFGGRLAEYKYYDMDDVIERAMAVTGAELGKKIA